MMFVPLSSTTRRPRDCAVFSSARLTPPYGGRHIEGSGAPAATIAALVLDSCVLTCAWDSGLVPVPLPVSDG